MPISNLNLPELKRAYERRENVTRLLRDAMGTGRNEQEAIQVAYDLQAGSYVAAMAAPEAQANLARYSAAIAAILTPLRATSLLEAGVGEATTLAAVIQAMGDARPDFVRAFDLSWSRVHVARRHLEEKGVPGIRLSTGELEAIPLADAAVDVVFTSHAVEPNHGREEEILAELYRVARRYLVLLEPAYELAGPEARTRMEQHGYCRGLREIAERLGGKVLEHRLLGLATNPLNPTGLLVLEKPAEPLTAAAYSEYVCPSCRRPLISSEGNLFCAEEGLVYPVLRGIPCLLRTQAILASKYLL